MNNILLIGCPCAGKSTTSSYILEDDKILKRVSMDDLVKSTIYPLCDLLLMSNGEILRDKLLKELNGIKNISKYNKSSIDAINNIDKYLNSKGIAREDFIQNFNNYGLNNALPKEIKGMFFLKKSDIQKLKELFEINDKLNEILNKNDKCKALLENIPRKTLIQILNDENFQLDNKIVIQSYLNEIFKGYAKRDRNASIDINQATITAAGNAFDIKMLSNVPGIDTTDKFSMLIDCIKIEHSFDRLDKIQRAIKENQEMHDICFKIKEVLLIEIINNSVESPCLIDLGGGMTYYEGQGKFQDEYKFLKSSLCEILCSDFVINLLPDHNLEKAKEILIDRAMQRNNSEKFIKEIIEHFESKCDFNYTDTTIYGTEKGEILQQFGSLMSTFKNISQTQMQTEQIIDDLDLILQEYSKETGNKEQKTPEKFKHNLELAR